MITKKYSAALEAKLIEDFKKDFFEKLGYEPIVYIETRLKTQDDKYVMMMSLDDLETCFESFLPFYRGKFIKLDQSIRKKEIIDLRAIYCFIAKNMGYTLKTIGEKLGNKDHSTILHSIVNFKDWVAVDPNFKNKYNNILNHIVNTQNRNNESSTLEYTDQMECES